MQQVNTTFFKSISILFNAFLAGQVIFAVMAFYLVNSGSFGAAVTEPENIFFILVPALIIAGRLIGNMLYKKKIQHAQNLTTTASKLDAYRAAFILRCALLEGPVLFAVIAFMLLHTIEILAFVAGGIFLFFLLKPNKEKIAAALQVAADEIV